MDREKVIKGWECHMEADTLGCADCPYRQGWRTCNFADTLFKDVYDLLKEQEATIVIESENMYTGLPITHCPQCGKSLDRYLYGRQREGKINFCPYCGQAVKW